MLGRRWGEGGDGDGRVLESKYPVPPILYFIKLVLKRLYKETMGETACTQ